MTRLLRVFHFTIIEMKQKAFSKSQGTQQAKQLMQNMMMFVSVGGSQNKRDYMKQR